LGTVNIRNQIDAGYKLGIKRHNEQVSKNRDFLEKILNRVKFCGNYELPLGTMKKLHQKIMLFNN